MKSPGVDIDSTDETNETSLSVIQFYEGHISTKKRVEVEVGKKTKICFSLLTHLNPQHGYSWERRISFQSIVINPHMCWLGKKTKVEFKNNCIIDTGRPIRNRHV